MKLRKFFEERLKLRKSSHRQESPAIGDTTGDPNAAAAAAGNASKRAAAVVVANRCADGEAHPPCLACSRPSGQPPRFRASAPAAMGMRPDYLPLGSPAGRARLAADWIGPPPPLPPPPAGVHSIAADPLATAAAAAVTPVAVAAASAERSRCATIVEATAESDSEPGPLLQAPELQYYTVPRCRSRIKTNPWIPTPHSIACREGVPCPCRRLRRRQSDTTASATRLLPADSDAFGRSLPVAAATGCGDGCCCFASPPCHRCGDGCGFSSGESGYATTGRRFGGGGGDDDERLSLNDDDYYDWHETLLEAFTPVTRGDSVSSADDESSVGHAAECSAQDASADDGGGGGGSSSEDGPPPPCIALGPPLTIDGGDGADREGGCDDDNGREGGDNEDARGDGGSHAAAADRAADPALVFDDAVARRAHDGVVGLAARVQRLREYKSVLHEKIRLARIECQLILSSSSPSQPDGGDRRGGGGRCCSDDEEARR